MIEKPHFSIITPTYNRAEFLPEMIKSVQAQSFQNYEHIIVDDGSTDKTEELVSSFAKNDPRIVYIKQENKGRSTARNVGIEQAKGEYICFLDSDDVWLPEHLQNIYNFTSTLQNPAFVFTGLAYRFPDNKQTEKRFPKIGETMPIDYVIGNQVSTITVGIHHSILAKHSFNPSLFLNEDLELWARIVAEYPMHYIDVVTAVAVQHDSNTQAVHSDSVTPQKQAMNVVFNNPDLKPFFSAAFKHRKLRGLDELQVRQYEKMGTRWKLVLELVKFLLLYPQNQGNKAKLVTLIYNLPGGNLIKRLVRA